MSHLLILLGYLIISIMFSVGFYFAKRKKAKWALISLTGIFVLCALTRAGMMMGAIDHLYFQIAEAILVVCTYTFIFTGKPNEIVNSLQDFDDKAKGGDSCKS